MPILRAISEAPIRLVRADDDVEVFEGDGWHFGMLAEWRLYANLGWVGWVRWNAAPGENRIDLFLADDIRRVTPPSQR